jgi:chromosome segregation ATPase
MEQKIRFVLGGLIAISVILVLLFVQTLGSKQAVVKERDNLKNENATLNSRVGKLETSVRDYENKVSSLNKDIDRVSRDRDDIQKKYDLASKARDELVEKLKSLPARAAAISSGAALTTDAYWAGIVRAKTDLELQLENARKELKLTQISNEELQRAKSSLELAIDSLNRDKDELKKQVEYNQKVMDSISQELVIEKNDKMQTQVSFKTIKNESALLNRQLNSLNNRLIDLQRKLNDVQQEKTTLERRNDEIETMLTGKLLDINKLKTDLENIRQGKGQAALAQERKSAVELPPIVVRPQAAGAPQETAAGTGKVLALNKENNFAIIDLGDEAGVKAGDAFGVYQGGQKIANIEVIKTSRTVAACDIKKEISPIKIGDVVR